MSVLASAVIDLAAQWRRKTLALVVSAAALASSAHSA